MNEKSQTKEALLQRVRQLEQRLQEAEATISILKDSQPSPAASGEPWPQAEEFQQQTEELQTQAEELEMQKDELEKLAGELEAERALLRTVLEQMPGGVILAAAPSGKFLLANQQMEAILGQPVVMAEGLADYCHYQGFHRDGRPYRPQDYPLAEAITTGRETSEKTVDILRGDGSPKVLQVSAAPVRNRKGEIIAGVATYRDISARQQREREIQRLASFPQLNPNPVLEVDTSGYLHFYNQAAVEAVEPLGGQAAVSDFVPADLPEILAEAISTGQKIFRREVRIGAAVFLVTLSYLENLEVVRLYAVDITGRKRAQDALLRAKQEWERTFDAVPDLIAILNQQHRIVRVNRAMAQALGAAPEDLVGRHCYEMMHQSPCPPEICPHSRLLQDGQGHTAELRELDCDFLVTVAPLMDDQGRLLGSVHIARDISERRQAEKALQRAHVELEHRVAERTAELRQTVAQLEEEVTVRLEAEQTLEFERQRLFAVLESIPAHVSLLRPDYTFVFVNGEFLRRFGEPGDRRCYELLGETSPCEECQAMAVFKTGAPVIREWTRPDGRAYRIYDYPFTDVDGSPLALEMGIDITDRLQAEKQAQNLGRLYRVLSRVNETILRANEQKTLFQEVCRIAVEDGGLRLAWVGLADPQDGAVQVVAQYGHDDGYLESLRIPLAGVPESRGPTGVAVIEGRFDICNDFVSEPRMAPWRERALARGYRSSGAFPLRLGGNVVGAFTIYSDRPGFFNQEEIGLLESLADDLSFALESLELEKRRRQAEEEVRVVSAYARSLIEASLDPLVTISQHGKITDVNKATEEATGIPRDRLIGSDFSDYFTEPDKARIGYKHVLAQGFVRDYPLALCHKSGRLMDVLYNATIFKDEAGEVQGVFAAARDITKRKRAEEELRRLNETLEQRVKERTIQLEAANQEMEAFSYSVSHDLKAPIRAIDGFSKILVESHADQLDAEALRLLGVVRQNTGYMGRLIEDLLVLARLGRRDIRKAPVDLAAMTITAFQSLISRTPERQVELSLKDLPPALGDPSLLNQVLLNLLDNAFKFTRRQENPVIEVGGWRQDGENVYYVKDNGVGFDMRYVDKLFGVFQRLHGNDIEGTGVGLAIVQRILKRHGGRVWAEGKVGEGATFYLALPAGEAQN